MNNIKKMVLPLRNEVIAKYSPSGIYAAWLFRRRLIEVLKEGGAEVLSDDKLTAFMKRYGPKKEKDRSEWEFLACDMVGEYRREIGAESYYSIYLRSQKEWQTK